MVDIAFNRKITLYTQYDLNMRLYFDYSHNSQSAVPHDTPLASPLSPSMHKRSGDAFAPLMSALIHPREKCPFCERDFSALEGRRWFSHMKRIRQIMCSKVGLLLEPGTPGTPEYDQWVKETCCRFYITVGAMADVQSVDPRTEMPISRMYDPDDVKGYDADEALRVHVRRIGDEPPVGMLHSGDYVADVANLMDQINDLRGELDQYDANSPEYLAATRALAPFDYKNVTLLIQRAITTRNYTPLVNKAWPKLYEMLMSIPNIIPRHVYRHAVLDAFFPAEYPGGMIWALKHYIMNTRPRLPPMAWMANSYVSSGTTALKKTKETPVDGAWLMEEDGHNGDLTNPDIHTLLINSIMTRTDPDRELPEASYGITRGSPVPSTPGVDMFIADGGMGLDDPADRKRYNRERNAVRAKYTAINEKKEDGDKKKMNKEKLSRYISRKIREEVEPVAQLYNEREAINAPLILGEMHLALDVLRLGGTAIIKCYTILTPEMVEEVRAWCRFFEEVVATKPSMSTVTGDEIYLVGIGFRGIDNPGPEVPIRDIYASEWEFRVNRQMKQLRKNNDQRAAILGPNATGVIPPREDLDQDLVDRILRKPRGAKPDLPNRPYPPSMAVTLPTQ